MLLAVTNLTDKSHLFYEKCTFSYTGHKWVKPLNKWRYQN